MMKWLGLLFVLVLGACSYPTRNYELAKIDFRSGYRSNVLEKVVREERPKKNRLENTLIIVTGSGGGSRAAAFTLGVLDGLRKVDIGVGGAGTMLDEIDAISTVSGSSVTSAYFALKGANGLDDIATHLLNKDGMKDLAWRGLNPVGLARLLTPSYERIDLTIDYFNDNLFDRATFGDLLTSEPGPYLILNAADMSKGAAFPFTQPEFDLLCSDLAKTQLAVGVAASAAFPVALSPVTLKNFSRCAAQKTQRVWPPLWVQKAAETDYYDNSSRLRRGRVAEEYAAPGDKKNFVHLLDGGIADNLGIAEPLRLLSSADVSPDYFTRITQGKITRIIFIMVNARSVSEDTLDASQATPGMLDMLLASINSSVDNASFSTADRVKLLLTERWRAYAEKLREISDSQQTQKTLKTLETLTREDNSLFVAVDFEAIGDSDCRRRFQNIATSWSVPGPKIAALRAMGQALLFQDPKFRKAMNKLSATVTGHGTTVDEACALVRK